MKSLTLAEVHQEELQMLDAFAKFCNKNDLQYWLVGGTLLGAVRHRGFIPWDDDVDVEMPRPDYDQFVELWKNQEYYLVNTRKNKSFHLPYSKIFDAKTCTNTDLHLSNGLFLDVFPYDGFGDNYDDAVKASVRINRLSRIVSGSMNPQTSKNKIKFFSKMLLRRAISLFGVERILAWVRQPISKFSYQNSKYVGSTFGLHIKNEIIQKRCFSESKAIPFENRVYYIPAGFDTYLTNMYGDYHSLPPEEQRCSHNIRVYWK